MNQKMLFIYNPKAGKSKIRTRLSDILDIFAAGGYEITICPTQKPGDALMIVETREAKYDLVVCSGGDGTLDEVVTGMVKSGISTPIGYIPAGSTNDFGGSISMSQNMVKAAQTIVNGTNFACDVGVFNQDVFVYIAAFGLFTEVSYETGQEIKNVLGHMAYLLEGMKSLSSICSYPMRVTYDNQVIEDDFIFGMITNSRSVGGFKGITGKHVKLDDGEFEVTLIKTPKNPIELNNLMVALVNRNIDNSAMYCFRAARLTLEAQSDVAWTLDGEYGGLHREVTIENMHKGMELRIGREVK